MKKYSYKYCVYFNNCGVGVRFISAHHSLSEALGEKNYIQNSGRRYCCDVERR